MRCQLWQPIQFLHHLCTRPLSHSMQPCIHHWHSLFLELALLYFEQQQNTDMPKYLPEELQCHKIRHILISQCTPRTGTHIWPVPVELQQYIHQNHIQFDCKCSMHMLRHHHKRVMYWPHQAQQELVPRLHMKYMCTILHTTDYTLLDLGRGHPDHTRTLLDTVHNKSDS